MHWSRGRGRRGIYELYLLEEEWDCTEVTRRRQWEMGLVTGAGMGPMGLVY